VTAVVLHFPDRRRGADWKPRKPGELLSRRLYVMLRHGHVPTSSREFSARAYELYLEGPPCWLHKVCVLSAGHSGDCRVPKEHPIPAWAMNKAR
jgi:hypothetical protein